MFLQNNPGSGANTSPEILPRPVPFQKPLFPHRGVNPPPMSPNPPALPKQPTYGANAPLEQPYCNTILSAPSSFGNIATTSNPETKIKTKNKGFFKKKIFKSIPNQTTAPSALMQPPSPPSVRDLNPLLHLISITIQFK